MEPAIQITNLSVEKSGQTLLHDLSVSIPSSKIIGLLGPSGAGKTTLIRAIVGRQRIAEGTVHVLGLPAGSPKLRTEIGYMPQSPAIYPDLTVKQNLHYFAKMRGEKQEAINKVTEATDLQKQSNQLASTLSGGQKSRLSLAIALLGNPKLLILDEPTVGVDPVLRQKLWKLFAKLADGGATVIVSSHVMDEASRCEALLLIRDGTLLAYGTPSELQQQTATKSVEASFLKLVRDAS